MITPKTILLLLLLSFGLVMCTSDGDRAEANAELVSRVRRTYLEGIARFEGSISALHSAAYRYDSTEGRMTELREAFYNSRKAYKHIEALAEYYSPVTAKSINGPALSEIAEEDPNQVEVPPEGLQVIEAQVFADEAPDREALMELIKTMKSAVPRLRATANTIEPTKAHLIDALKMQIARITSLGLSGFDSPEAENSISEAKSAIDGIRAFVGLLGNNGSVLVKLDAAAEALTRTSDFTSFDRLTFTRQHLSPLSRSLNSLADPAKLAAIDRRRMLRPAAGSIFEKQAFNAAAFIPGGASSTADAATLGRELFFDPVLSINGDRSCTTCHQPDRAFTDGEITSISVSGAAGKRNAPSLFNTAFQSSNFWDGRVAFLEDQIREVVLNKDEMHGSFEHALETLKGEKDYVESFNKSFAGSGLNEANVRRAIAAYLRSLVTLDSRFDRYMRGENARLNDQEKLGFNTFMGKGKCGTCHFAPLFNGTVPPAYTKTEVEVLGTPANADTLRPILDQDDGRYSVHGNRLHKRAFKTPTVRNAELTAPYMHNGVYKTLEEVVDFYDRGGGVGLGLSVENQTLSSDRLSLTPQEKQALVAFMRSLTDTSATVVRPQPRSRKTVVTARAQY